MKNSKKLSKEYKRKIVSLKRKHHHPLVHHIHKKHKISYKTLTYMKEYGPKSHVYHVILRESIRILLLASILSSIGGFGLQSIQSKIITILPLLILIPALNGMNGGYGAIISSKLTTMLYLRKIKGKWWKSEHVHQLFFSVFIIAMISSVFIGVLSVAAAYIKGLSVDLILLSKVIQISLITTSLLVCILFVLSATLGIYIYKKNEDPNNFLIPIATSVADLGSMAIFTLLVLVFF